MSPAPDRGHTFTEQYRHECEVRYVLAMPTRLQRAAYLDSLVKYRGQASADRLRADVAAAWRAAREAPVPNDERPAPAPFGAVHNPLNPAPPSPAEGSFPNLPHEGPLRRVGCVDSEGWAR